MAITVRRLDDVVDPSMREAFDEFKKKNPTVDDYLVVERDGQRKIVKGSEAGFSTLGAISANLIRSLPSSAATYLTTAGLGALMTPAGAAGGSTAPGAGTVAGGALGAGAALGGGILAGVGTELLTQKAMENFKPDWAEKFAITEKTHPWASTIGRMSSGYPLALNNPMALGALAKVAAKLKGTSALKEGAKLLGKPAAINAALEAGMQGVTEGLPESKEDALNRIGRIGLAALTGVTQMTPTKWGEALSRTGVRVVGKAPKAPTITKEGALKVYQDLVAAEKAGTLGDPEVAKSFNTRLGNDLPIEENLLRAKLRLDAIARGETAQAKKEMKEATKEPGETLKATNDLLAKANDADNEIAKIQEQLKAIPPTETDLLNRTQLALKKAQDEAASIRRTALENLAKKYPSSMEVGFPDREARWQGAGPIRPQDVVEGEIVPPPPQIEAQGVPPVTEIGAPPVRRAIPSSVLPSVRIGEGSPVTSTLESPIMTPPPREVAGLLPEGQLPQAQRMASTLEAGAPEMYGAGARAPLPEKFPAPEGALLDNLKRARKQDTQTRYSGPGTFPAVRKWLADFAPGMKGPELYQRRGRMGEPLGSTALNQLKFHRPFGLDVNDKGELPLGNLVDRMNNVIPPDEVEWYKAQGLEKFLGSQRSDVSAKDFEEWKARMGDEADTESFVKWRDREGGKISVDKLRAWMESVAPKVRVSEFGGSVSKDRIEYNELRHGLESLEGNANLLAREIDRRPWSQDDVPTIMRDIQSAMIADVDSKRLTRMLELKLKLQEAPDQPSAQWQSVTAKPKEWLDSHGYTELSVDVPGETQFSGQHRPFPNNTVGHSRGWWITGKELKEFNPNRVMPDDAKVFWIEEVQSDWAQQKRELDKKLAKEGRAPSEEMVADNPLLPHSNRITLKATIKHALDAGADAVVISDPETVMMTEQHDVAASMVRRLQPEEVLSVLSNRVQPVDSNRLMSDMYGADWQKGTYVRVNPKGEDLVLRIDKPEVNTSGGRSKELASELYAAGYGSKEGTYIPQEEGMRLNYGKELPKIMRELTGVQGEPISGGVHEKAIHHRDTWTREEGMMANDGYAVGTPVMRDNLIFKNPDGTPKTDASGLVYDLRKVKQMASEGANFSLLGNDKSFYGGLPPHIVRDAARYVLKAPDWAIKFLYQGTAGPNGLKGTMPLLDRVRNLGPEGAYIADKQLDLDATAQRIANRGISGYSEAFKGLTKNEMARVERYLYDMDDIGDSSVVLTPKEQAAADKMRDTYQYLREEQLIDGPLINGREAMINPDKVPHLMDRTAYNILHNQRPGMEQYDQLYNDWIARQMRKLNITAEEADANFKEFMTAGSLMDASNPSGAEYAAVRQAEGIGLPESWRAPLTAALNSHAIRTAKDLSWYRNFQKDPMAAKILGIKDDGRVREYDWTSPEFAALNDTVSLANNTAVRQYIAEYNLHKSYRPNIFDRWTSLGNSMLIGPKSAIRDLMSTHGHLAELMPGEDMPLMVQAWKNVIKGKMGSGENIGKRMEQVGAMASGDRAIEFQAPFDPDSIMVRLAHWNRVASGRDLIEKTARQFAFETGRLVANSRLAADDVGFFQKMKIADWKTMKPEELMDKVGMKFVEGSQGKYGVSGLPPGLLNSADNALLRTFLNLQRWGVERFNNWYKLAWRPAVDKGEFGPLLRGILGNLASAGALRWLEEELFNAKPNELTWKEWLKADDKETAYTVFNKLQVAGYGGILSGLISMPIKAAYGEKLYGLAEGGGPGLSALADVGHRLAQFTDGVVSGRMEFWPAVGALADAVGRDRMQFYRLMAARDERSLGNREERIYRRQMGLNRYMEPPKDNPFDAAYALRKARTVPEIEKALPAVESAYRRTGQLPQMRTPLRQVERDDGRPNFYQWLSSIQGVPAAETQWQTDLAGDQVTQAKRMALEELRRKVAISVGPP